MGLPARLFTGINYIPTKSNYFSISWETVVPIVMSGINLKEYHTRPGSGRAQIPQIPSTSGPGPSQGPRQHSVPRSPHSAGSSGVGSSVGSLYYSTLPPSAAATMFQSKAIQKKIGPRPVTKWTQMYGKAYRGDWQQSEEEFKKHLSERSPNVGQEIHNEDTFNTLFPGADADYPRNTSQVSGNFYPLWTDSESEGIDPPRPPARLSSIYRSAFPQGVPTNMPAELQQAIMAAAMPVPNTATFRRASLAERISNASGIALPPASPGPTDESTEASEESGPESPSGSHRKHHVRPEQGSAPGVKFGPLGPYPVVRMHFLDHNVPLPPREFADAPPANPSPEYLFGAPHVTVLGRHPHGRDDAKEEAAARKQPEF